MKNRIPFCALLIALLIITQCSQITTPQEEATTWKVYFSPRGGATEAIIRELTGAKNTIFVHAYKVTSAPIAKAITDAWKRGVKVGVILDKSQQTDKYSSATYLFNNGVPVRIDAKHKIQHNKVMVIDSKTIITGSFNFSKAAEKSNAENLLIVRDKQLAGIYTKNWKEHADHSKPYTPKN